MIIDKILLAPYYWTLKFRHFLYDSGIRKTNSADVPTISVGNITVGGTGKTPHTEMIIRMLSESPVWKDRNIAVLSRGYKRKSKGFQQVMTSSPATESGDEPLQVKRKFPSVTVAVDKSRTEGCSFLSNPELLKTSKKARKCKHKDLRKADIIILDDAFQHRTLKPDLSIVLVSYSRPIDKDHLLPFGRLRDLPERVSAADVLIISKSPAYIDEWERMQWAESLGIKGFSPEECRGKTSEGKDIYLFFTDIRYDTLTPVFPEGELRYTYSQRAVIFTGIADDSLFLRYLGDTYKIKKHLSFADHHTFNARDIRTIEEASEDYPTAVVITTEKDSQRISGCPSMPDILKERMFYVPIKTGFLSVNEEAAFTALLENLLPR